MTDSSEVGRYGTLRLLKRREPQTTLAFFPVDDESVSFGRSKQCSIRLYYDCVSELHCTLQISEEHKAFLVVHGTNGLMVDGCHVVPSRTPGSGPITVPLTNGSEIEIYKKRFKFEYPPKEIRAALLATPRNASRRRSLRMSMIESAQVFTPRADASTLPKTPRRWDLSHSRDLMALKSPVKIPSQDSSPEQETILLEGEEKDALIVEEEKDIIVLEQVDDDGQEPSATKPKFNRVRSVAFSIPASTPPPGPTSHPQSVKVAQRIPQVVPTHRRRSLPSLHRAVVLRSAHLALQREQQRFEEQQQEEDEVEAEITPERELGPLEVDAHEDYEEQDDEDEDDEIAELQSPVVQLARPARRVSAFRASLDAMRNIIPLPFNWKAPGEVPLPDDDDDDDDDDDEDVDDDDEKENDDNTNNQVQDYSDGSEDDQEEPETETPVRRNLGPFMTPQVNRPAQHIPVDVKPRASIDGNVFAHKPSGRAQRVRVVPAWKVNDIVIPEPEKPPAQGKQESKRQPISEEERQAINARRKSALQSPSHLPVPGPRKSELASAQRAGYMPGEDSDEDTGTMLEKMQQKLADARRKSEARRASLAIGSRQPNAEFSLLASNTKRSGTSGAGVSEDEGSSHTPPRTGASLTPRFDGVREMFRQPPREPKTPSFTGFRTMFKENAQPDPKTPSFRGVKELFNSTQRTAGPSTPLLNLGEVFDEDEDDAVDLMDEEDGPRESEIDESSSAPHAKSNDELEAFASGPKTRRKALGSASKQPSKEVARVDVPSAVPEEQDENEDSTRARPKARSPVRRGAKRSAKIAAAAPASSDAPPGGRAGSRNAGKGKTSDSEDVKGDTAVKRTSKARKRADSRTDDEEQIATSSKTHNNAGRGKRSKPQAGKTTVDPEQDELKNPPVKARTRKAKAVETSDGEEAVQPKPRRTRTTKGLHDGGSAPAQDLDLATTAHVKAEEESTHVVPPVSKPQKSKRSAKSQVGEQKVRSPAERVDNLHETEGAAGRTSAAPAKSSRAGSKRKEAVKASHTSHDDGTSDNEKENIVGRRQQHEPSDKTRTRRGAAATAAATHIAAGVSGEGPTKRTRSRK